MQLADAPTCSPQVPRVVEHAEVLVIVSDQGGLEIQRCDELGFVIRAALVDVAAMSDLVPKLAQMIAHPDRYVVIEVERGHGC